MNDFFKLKKIDRCLGFFYMGKFDHSDLETKERDSVFSKTELYF